MYNHFGSPAWFLIFCCLLFNSASAENNLEFQIDEKPASTNVPRLGINLGEWVSWGASQYPANILKNPGFEGIIDRAIVIVKAADERGFSDDTNWTKRPDGFWAGAQYEVRSGRQAGSKGEVFDSVASDSQGWPRFTIHGKAPALATGDVVSLTRINDSALPEQWWFSKEAFPGQLSIETHDRRPGSPGIRSLALKPNNDKPADVISYLDGIGERSGKLLAVNGEWRLRFWFKETEPGAKLSVRFRRVNGANEVFFQETFQATSNWQFIERNFRTTDKGAAAPLELTISSQGDKGRVLLDDIELGPVSKDNPTAFRSEVLTALKQLQPGYLRDWQGQLGDTLENRLADPFARRSNRYRPGDSSLFSYSVDEFFQLAQAVGSQPWLIIPPTLGDEELQKLGQYLAKQIDVFHFKEVLVEFGNENWNIVFRPAGISEFKAHGETATRAFQQLLAGANKHPAIRTIVNGQYVNPWAALKMLESTPNAQALAVAPYFLFKLDKTDDPLTALFKQDDFFTEELKSVQSLGKELMVYEVNLHTTGGDADLGQRDRATTGAASGAALAKRLMIALTLGVKRQCVYQLSQYDAFVEQTQGAQGLVKLWGVTRDLGETQRLRPTGLAMSMLNQALPADVHNVKSSGSDQELSLTAFHRQTGWAVAAVSAKSEPQKITIHYPANQQKTAWRVLRLKSATPFSSNEHAEEVSIAEESLMPQENSISITLKPFEFVMLIQS
ncbi:MAG: hypothetical protein QX198_03680 [Methylococcaceae bacterium]